MWKHELTDEQGGFYCGQDADSDGVEGKVLCVYPRGNRRTSWAQTRDEHFCRKYGITGRGNFEGKSIPNLLENEAYEEIREEQFACGKDNNTACGDNRRENIKKLYDYRISRTRLHKDDKILVSWNGWMICACAKAGAVLEKRNIWIWLSGRKTFIHKTLTKDGRLHGALPGRRRRRGRKAG